MLYSAELHFIIAIDVVVTPKDFFVEDVRRVSRWI